MLKFIGILLLASLGGCVSFYEPIPQGYDGETATIIDSYARKTSVDAHYFYVTKIDKKSVETSWYLTRVAHIGKGTKFSPIIKEHLVTTQEQTFSIIGHIFYPTDAQGMFSDDLTVEKNITFSPKAGELYSVKGQLSPQGSLIWIEDSSGLKVAGS